MALPNLPLWAFEPNWSDSLTETLEWLTDILRSPTGAEQRRCLRPFPRRSFEFEVALEGRERAFFDNLVTVYGGRDWYFPLWHDPHHLTSELRIGSRKLSIPTASSGEFRPGDAVLLADQLPFDTEIVQIESITKTGLTLTAPLTRQWSFDTRIFPLRKARLTEQPSAGRMTDTISTARARLSITERNDGVALTTLPQYRTFPILTIQPNESEKLDYGYERMLEQIDNQTAIPFNYDSANLSFPNQKFSWLVHGRSEHREIRSLLYTLRGRATLVWLPTYFNDFELAAPIAARGNRLTVWNSGFAQVGGPRPGRQDILIEMMDGTSFPARITGAAQSSNKEILVIDRNFPQVIRPEDVLRISFLALNRLNQDSIEIAHMTDCEGVATLSASFRTTPDLRIDLPGIKP